MRSVMDQADAALVRVGVQRWDGQAAQAGEDEVAEEVPVALEYNGIAHAVMLASPDSLEDFALGFSLSEGILADSGELYECELDDANDGCTVRMRIASERFAQLKDKRRSLTGRTGCGLCGTETLAQAIRRPPAVTCTALFSAEQLHEGMRRMKAQQHLQHATGGTHAAAWMRADGEILLVREDVGRHNALDKLIGALARGRVDVTDGAALITSRASYEMVQKCATVGIGFLAAISAPTGLAVRLAEAGGMTLLGFVRENSHVAYAGAQRMRVQANGKEMA
jgi:FdhD protein